MPTPDPEHPIGLIAGSGQLPLLFAQKVAIEQSRPVVVAAHVGETDQRMNALVAEVLWVPLGRFKKIVAFFRARKVRELVLVGGIAKASIWRVRPDTMALKLVWRLRHLHDDLLLRGIAAELAALGFQVRSVTDYLPQLLAPAGVLTRRQPDESLWNDITIGWRAAKVLGQLDIGQGVIVKRKIVITVEAIEGTDAMIARAGALTQNSGSGWAGRGEMVLVKTAKPGQDLRLDLPTVGPGTIEKMQACGISVLAIEADRTLLLDPEQTIRLADRYGHIVVVCEELGMNKRMATLELSST
ncbi:MAG: UDP-2,3-diacylglucosamine diphosphatase LpxI [Magnetococcales bacterium]|nr:UDP-2,3-diacylglucosamine diphosphatase LpxI [Magnetococcales bacterium]